MDRVSLSVSLKRARLMLDEGGGGGDMRLECRHGGALRS